MGVGLSFVYFLLDAGNGHGIKSREESLMLFMSNLKTIVPQLQPSFFFTDIESSQIKAI